MRDMVPWGIWCYEGYGVMRDMVLWGYGAMRDMVL